MRSPRCPGSPELTLELPSYVASLESKLEKLEKRLVALDSRRRSIPPEANGDSTPGPTTAADPTYSPRSARRKKLEADSEIEDLVADLGYMFAVPRLTPPPFAVAMC